MVCLQLHVSKCASVVKMLWVLVCIYPGLVLAMCYMYQFEELRLFLAEIAGESLIRSIGLVHQPDRLFGYLFQHVVVFFLVVLQFRIFFMEMSGTNPISLPLWIVTIIELLQRIVIVHGQKVVAVLMAVASSQYASVLDFVSFAVFVLWTLIPRTSRVQMALSLLWFEVSRGMKNLYQICSSCLHWFGWLTKPNFSQTHLLMSTLGCSRREVKLLRRIFWSFGVSLVCTYSKGGEYKWSKNTRDYRQNRDIGPSWHWI